MKTYNIKAYKISLVRDSGVSTPNNSINGSRDAADILKTYLEGTDREHMVALLLNTKNKVIGIHTVSVGSLSASIVHPREVFKAAIVANAAAVILGHNHPSGDTRPSQEDILLTKRLVQGGDLLGIQVLDHIVLNTETGDAFSFRDNGMIEGRK